MQKTKQATEEVKPLKARRLPSRGLFREMAHFLAALKAWPALSNTVPCVWAKGQRECHLPGSHVSLCPTELVKAGPPWLLRGLAEKNPRTTHQDLFGTAVQFR